MIKLKARIVQRRATSSEWTTTNPTLLPGEFGYELDTHKLKVGELINGQDGHWNDLPYFFGGATLPDPSGGVDGQVLVINNGDWDIGDPAVLPEEIEVNMIESTDYSAGADLYYSGDGTLISLAGAGYVRAKNFAIDSSGNLYLKGVVAAESGYFGDGADGFSITDTGLTATDTSGTEVYTLYIASDGTLVARPQNFERGVDFTAHQLQTGVLTLSKYDGQANEYGRIIVDSQSMSISFDKEASGAITTDSDVEDFALNGENGTAYGSIGIDTSAGAMYTTGTWTLSGNTYLSGHSSETILAWLTRLDNGGYVLPTASASTKGGIKVQVNSGLTMTGDNLSVAYGAGLSLSSGSLVVDTTLIATQSWVTSGFAPASHSHTWSSVTSKPFSTIGTGLTVVNDALVADSVTYTAGAGITITNLMIGHSNLATTPKSTQAVYPITFDSYGHITGSGSAVTIPVAPGTLNTTNATAQTAIASESLSGTINLHKVSKTGDYGDLLNKPTLGTAAAKDITNLYSATGTDPITGTGVAAALATLPTPMQFQGTVGTSGTIEWSALPSASSSNNGYTYKVITDHSSDPVCKAGDTIISNGTTWVVIPSGDEPAGTVTSVGITNGGGLSVSGSPITSSGTITLSHADTSSQASVSNTGRTYIQSITLDTYGHVTALSSATETASGAGTLDTTNTSALATSASEALSGAVALHKIAKTGTYSDLIGKPNPIAAGNGISIITNSGTGADDISILISSNDVGLAIDSTDHGLKADTTVLALKSELPTVNNATLTIQKNSTSVGTFTANASTDATIDISVPTKVSDLTNDSGFITGVAWADVTSKPFASLGDGLTVASTVLKVNLGSDLKFDSSNPKKITHTNSVTAQTTQAIYPIKIDAQGHISAYGTAVTIPTVNNATLTIQRNSTSVGTFTANASTDVTLDISVPTTTSELTNDAGFITGVTWTDVTSKPFASLGDGLTTASSALKVNLGSDLKFDSSSPKKITHTNSVTAQTTQALYPIKIDAQGHISAYGTAVTIPTIPGADRGISLVSDKYGHSNAAITAVTTQGLYKLAFDAYGHITDYTAYTDQNIYHKTGSWSDLTYTATKVGSTSSSDDLAFTIPTGTTGTTVALGNHTHSLALATDTGTSTITLASGGKYKLTAGGSTLIFTMPTDSGNTATAADNILDGSNSGTEITYAPYSTQQSRLSFDTSTTAPTRTDRLNLNGYLYATKLYSGGTEVSVSGHTHAWSSVTSKPFSTVGSGLTVSSDTLAVDFTAVATADHTHTLSMAGDTGTSALALAANTKYKLTAGGSTFIFTTPPDNNTTYTGEKGITVSSANKIGHSNTAITAVTTQGLYQLAFDTYGHITGYTAYTDQNSYHTSGSWDGLTYTATAVGGAGALAFTLPTGDTATTVAAGNHTHGLTLAADTGTSTVSLSANTKYKLTAGGSTLIFTTPADTNTATAADNILDGSNSGTQITYQPYSATTATSTWVGTDGNAGKLYLGTQAPSKTTRLNYNGYFYAKKLYSDGAEVLTSIAWDNVGSKPFTSVGDGLTVASTVLKVNLGSDLKFDSSNPKKITHNNAVTAQTTQAVYPIKIDAQGHISAYGTAVTIPTITLNGSATTSPSFYAPAGAGTSGQYLKSSGTGAPTWATFPTIPTITLNGSATTSPSFYAPTGAGTSGQYLASSGTGAPTWTNFPTIPTIPGADRGISLVSSKYGHSNTAITAVTTQGLYKIAMDAYGHITGYTAYTDANSYHTSGSWSGLTYTATAVGGAGELALTLPTGTTSTTVAAGNHTHTTSLASDSGTSTVSLTYGGKFKLTAGGTSVIFTMPASDNTDTKQNVTLATTSKAFLTGVTTTPTGTAQALTGVADTGVYLTTIAGEFSAVRHSFNVSGTEKAYMAYNSTTDAIDFIFV